MSLTFLAIVDSLMNGECFFFSLHLVVEPRHFQDHTYQNYRASFIPTFFFHFLNSSIAWFRLSSQRSPPFPNSRRSTQTSGHTLILPTSHAFAVLSPFKMMLARFAECVSSSGILPAQSGGEMCQKPLARRYRRAPARRWRIPWKIHRWMRCDGS